MAKRKYWSMFEPYKDEIFKLIEEGYCLRDIYKKLFDGKEGYVYESLSSYVAKRRKRGELPSSKYSPCKCSECDNLKSIKRCIKDQKDVLMCQETYREVNKYGITHSPMWCPKRNMNEKAGVM